MDTSETEPDYSNLPIEERVIHKNWKVRSESYAELKKIFDNSGSENDDCFAIFQGRSDLLKKIVTDSNVIAQEAGTALLCSYLKNCGTKACLSTREAIIPILCEKSLGSGRQGTRQNTLDSVLYYIELDTPEPVIELIIPILSAKIPKLIAGAVKLLNDCYAAYGCKTISPKLILNIIPKLFSHTDKNVRAEATTLSVTLRSWMGDTFDSIIFPELKKEVQRKDLSTAFAQLEGPIPPTRILKSQQKVAATAASSASASSSHTNGDDDVEMGNISTSDQAMDVFDMVDAVDILSKIPSDLPSKLASSIWKERVGVLDETLKEIANVKKVEASRDYGDLVRLMARCMKDANLQVVTLACSITAILANGLRNGFHKYVHLIFAQTLERTKEKKQSVLDALNSVLYACFEFSSFSEVFETVIANTTHKTPQIKIESLRFLVKCLQNTTTCPKKSEIDVLMDTCIKLLKDSQAPVRNLASESIGTLMKITGERRLNPYLMNMNDPSSGLHQAKIKEFFENATVKASPNDAVSSTAVAAAPARRTAASSTATSGRKPAETSKQSLVNTRLANPSTLPSKRGPPSPTRTNEQPSSSSRLGNGLASRSLAHTSNSLLPPPTNANSLSVDKRELLELRGERDKWNSERESYESQFREFQMEKERFLNEIKSLNNKNDQLRNEIANVTVNSKSKDTQIQRLTNDLDRLNRRVKELENVSVSTTHSSSLSPVRHESILGSPNTRKGISPIRFNGPNSSSLNTLDSMGIGISHNSDLSSRVSGLTINSKLSLNNSDPQKENKVGPDTAANESSGVKSQTLMDSTYSSSVYETDVTDDIWKRTSEASNSLRNRIMMMKNRSREFPSGGSNLGN